MYYSNACGALPKLLGMSNASLIGALGRKYILVAHNAKLLLVWGSPPACCGITISSVLQAFVIKPIHHNDRHSVLSITRPVTVSSRERPPSAHESYHRPKSECFNSHPPPAHSIGHAECNNS